MALTFGPDLFARLEADQAAACKDRLWQHLTAEGTPEPGLREWFDEVWNLATGPMGLSDCAMIARYLNIVATADIWQANPLWRTYVENILDDPYDAIPRPDRVLAVHKHILEDRILASGD